MKRIVSANASATRPTSYSADGAAMGYFVEPNYGTNPPTPGTILDAEWANSVQEEIAQTITTLGGELTHRGDVDPATAQLPGLLSGVLRGETALPGAAIAFSQNYPPCLAILGDGWKLDTVNAHWYFSNATNHLHIPLTGIPLGASLNTILVGVYNTDTHNDATLAFTIKFETLGSAGANQVFISGSTLTPNSTATKNSYTTFTLTVDPSLVIVASSLVLMIEATFTPNDGDLIYNGAKAQLTRTKLAS